MIIPAHEWFARRRFVTVAPPFRQTAWSVDDLATNIRVITDISVEEAGLYADTLEERFNSVQPGQPGNDDA